MFVGAGNICAVWETTKCCIPARKSGKSQNSREALGVIVGMERVDAQTVGRPQLDRALFRKLGSGIYAVCPSAAACFYLFKHRRCVALKLYGNGNKMGENQTWPDHHVRLGDWHMAAFLGREKKLSKMMKSSRNRSQIPPPPLDINLSIWCAFWIKKSTWKPSCKRPRAPSKSLSEHHRHKRDFLWLF